MSPSFCTLTQSVCLTIDPNFLVFAFWSMPIFKSGTFIVIFWDRLINPKLVSCLLVIAVCWRFLWEGSSFWVFWFLKPDQGLAPCESTIAFHRWPFLWTHGSGFLSVMRWLYAQVGKYHYIADDFVQWVCLCFFGAWSQDHLAKCFIIFSSILLPFNCLE